MTKKMNSAKVAVPTYIRLKTNDSTRLVVKYDDGHVEFDKELMYKIEITSRESREDNLIDAVEEMKGIIFEKYGKVRIASNLIECMKELFVEKNTPKRLDYTDPRHWTTGRLPKKVREEYEEGRKEEMRQLRRDAWETFKK